MKTLKLALVAMAFALALGGTGVTQASAAQEGNSFYNGGQGYRNLPRWGHSYSWRHDRRHYNYDNRRLNRRYNRHHRYNRHRNDSLYFNFGPNGLFFGFGR